MRKANQEIKDPAILEGILKGSQVCRMAMMDGPVPYLLPFNYGYRDGCIYIHSAPAGKKIDLLTRNPQVCFEIEETAKVIPEETACRWATLYRSVVGCGVVEILSHAEGKKNGLEIIMAQHGAPEQTDFHLDELDRMVILKLTITSFTGKQSGNWARESKT